MRRVIIGVAVIAAIAILAIAVLLTNDTVGGCREALIEAVRTEDTTPGVPDACDGLSEEQLTEAAAGTFEQTIEDAWQNATLEP